MVRLEYYFVILMVLLCYFAHVEIPLFYFHVRKYTKGKLWKMENLIWIYAWIFFYFYFQNVPIHPTTHRKSYTKKKCISCECDIRIRNGMWILYVYIFALFKIRKWILWLKRLSIMSHVEMLCAINFNARRWKEKERRSTHSNLKRCCTGILYIFRFGGPLYPFYELWKWHWI